MLIAWLNEREMDEWDREMHADFSPGARGMQVLEKVKANIGSGKFRPMDRTKH